MSVLLFAQLPGCWSWPTSDASLPRHALLLFGPQWHVGVICLCNERQCVYFKNQLLIQPFHMGSLDSMQTWLIPSAKDAHPLRLGLSHRVQRRRPVGKPRSLIGPNAVAPLDREVGPYDDAPFDHLRRPRNLVAAGLLGARRIPLGAAEAVVVVLLLGDGRRDPQDGGARLGRVRLMQSGPGLVAVPAHGRRHLVQRQQTRPGAGVARPALAVVHRCRRRRGPGRQGEVAGGVELVLDHAQEEVGEEDPDGGDPRTNDPAVTLNKGQYKVDSEAMIPELVVLLRSRGPSSSGQVLRDIISIKLGVNCTHHDLLGIQHGIRF